MPSEQGESTVSSVLHRRRLSSSHQGTGEHPQRFPPGRGGKGSLTTLPQGQNRVHHLSSDRNAFCLAAAQRDCDERLSVLLCFSTAVPWLLPWSDQDLHPLRRAGESNVGSFAPRRSLADGAQIKA